MVKDEKTYEKAAKFMQENADGLAKGFKIQPKQDWAHASCATYLANAALKLPKSSSEQSNGFIVDTSEFSKVLKSKRRETLHNLDPCNICKKFSGFLVQCC